MSVLLIRALDAFGNVASGYDGTLFFGSNDYQAELPEPVQLTNGIGAFNVVLKTAGSRTFGVTELIHGALAAKRRWMSLPDRWRNSSLSRRLSFRLQAAHST